MSTCVFDCYVFFHSRLLTLSMADSTTKNAMGEFTIFIRLPPELRLHIWCHALPSEDEFPNKDTQTLYPTEQGFGILKFNMTNL